MKALTFPPSVYYSEQILQHSRVHLNHQRPIQKKASRVKTSRVLNRFCSWVDISISTRWKFSSPLIQNKKNMKSVAAGLKTFTALLHVGCVDLCEEPFHDFIMFLSFLKRNKGVCLFYQTSDLKCVNCNFFLMIPTAVAHSAGSHARHQVDLVWYLVLSVTKDPRIPCLY